ncbi:MAG: YopX family protein [Parachlamydiales bacterium]|jgi:uncharacterized phage protein (TIGR01671 family)
MEKREIKFRAWDKKISDMLYWDSKSQKFSNIFWNMVKDENMPLMQYTGLKDKNGTEIYEGDIVQNTAAKWEVIFNKGCFCGRHLRFYTLEDETHLALRAILNIEIIGNIYENPELLKS